MQDMWVRFLGQEDPVEEEMVTHSSILAWSIPWTVACQTPLSMAFSRQEYWSGLPFPPPRDLPDPGIKPASLASPAVAGILFTTEPPGKPWYMYIYIHLYNKFGICTVRESFP